MTFPARFNLLAYLTFVETGVLNPCYALIFFVGCSILVYTVTTISLGGSSDLSGGSWPLFDVRNVPLFTSSLLLSFQYDTKGGSINDRSY
ncbi:Immunoglobulin A1 protease autotransporter [Fusarium oxysporum f. sp. albedinis]|nr:Immunoglobulin A1 protease autotransporter [Fusarium oxysporum f. sp. albedinis]